MPPNYSMHWNKHGGNGVCGCVFSLFPFCFHLLFILCDFVMMELSVDIHFTASYSLLPIKSQSLDICISFLPRLLSVLVEQLCCAKPFDCAFCAGCLICEDSLVSQSGHNLMLCHKTRMDPLAQVGRSEQDSLRSGIWILNRWEKRKICLLEQEGPCGALGHQRGSSEGHEGVTKRKVPLGYEVRERDEKQERGFNHCLLLRV